MVPLTTLGFLLSIVRAGFGKKGREKLELIFTTSPYGKQIIRRHMHSNLSIFLYTNVKSKY